METPDDAFAHMNMLHESVWELAAIALSLRDPASVAPELRSAAGRVTAEAGLDPVIGSLVGDDPRRLAGRAAAPILQAAALLTGARQWTSQDDEALLAQGRASAQSAILFERFAVPAMEGLADLLKEPSPVILDVGVGVAAMAVAWCQSVPGLRVVGLDVFERALQLASRTVADAGMADRIELRHQDVADMTDRDRFCLAWLPAPFVPASAIEAGLPRMVSALVPGGWIVLGHGKFDESSLKDALTRFQTVAFGGTALDDDEAEGLLVSAGLEAVATLATPPGAPAITVGRRPTLR